MIESTNGLAHQADQSNDVSWKLGPRDFVLKNIKYIPWIILSALVAVTLAYLKIRYSTPIYVVQSSMLISNQGGGGKEDRFDALLMTPGTENLSNEMRILTSRPVLQRVVNSLHLYTRYFNIGKVRTTLLYPESPFSIEFINRGDELSSLELQITIVNDQQFKIGKENKVHEFGEILNIGGRKIVLLRDLKVDLKNFGTCILCFSTVGSGGGRCLSRSG